MTAARDRAAEQDAMAWRDRANCIGLDPELFFPGRGEMADEALAVCAACEVRAECLEYALATRQHYGVWGGKSERQRRRIRVARARASQRAPKGAA